MAYFETDAEKLQFEIEAARDAVKTAQRNYSKGKGTCEAVNKADRKLADAWAEQRAWSGGNVPVR